MKKFLSLIIAMLLIVSFTATTAVAFADEAEDTYKVTYVAGDQGTGTGPAVANKKEGDEVTLAAVNAFTANKGYELDGWKVEGLGGNEDTLYHPYDTFTMPANDVTITAIWKDVHKVTINEDALHKYLAEDEFFNQLKIEMGDVKFGEELMKDVAKIEEVFGDIVYVKDNTDTQKTQFNDKVYVEYCRPSESPKGQENWQNSTLITDNMHLSSSGWYLFRIVVKDYSGKNTIATSAKFSRYAEDTSAPIVSLSDSMKDKVKSGLTEGTKYSVSTSLSITDSSSTTVTYNIEKLVNGVWTLVYDSTKETDKVTEGYEKYIGTDGSITPAKEDISDKPVYRINYAVVDANGYVGIENGESKVPFATPMELFVKAADVEKKAALSPVEIVLFSIAGAAAIGILVLLFIKPKQPAPARTAAKSDDVDANDTTDTTEE